MKHIYFIFILLMFFMIPTLLAQDHWTKYSGNPVLTPGPAGEWDEGFAAIPSVLFDGSTYHLWYNNYNYVANSIDKIGYATSNDGLTWTKYDDLTTTNPPYSLSDPVLTPGPGNYDNVAVGNHCVRKFNNIYHMWYTGDNHPAGNQGYSICHATSSDGIHWSKDTLNPVLEVGSNGEWDDALIFAPSVVFDGSIYHMWYSGWDGSISPDRVRIGHATSTHPDSTWTKDPGNPVLDIGTSTCWDYDRVDAPDVVFDGTRFHMFYSGGPIFTWRIGYAWSTDGSQWTKNNNPNTTDPLFIISDPILFRGSYGTWDGINVSHSSVLLDTTNNRFKMWYTGADAVPGTAQVGYATAPVSTHNVPGNYSTIQAAINAAVDGDIVLVADDTYQENINFKGKAITVASHYYFDGDTSHISNTIIDGSNPSHPDSGSVVTFNSGEDTTSVLYGFTITNGTGTISYYTWGGVQYPCRAGGGIFCGNSGGRFVSNIIKNNSVSDNNVVIGGGLAAGDFGSEAWVILENNKIINNAVNSEMVSASGGGVGITCNGKIINNVIANDSCISSADQVIGGGIRVSTAHQYPRTVYIIDNHITHNFIKGTGTSANGYWAASGGGIRVDETKTLILNNEISNNLVNSFGTGYGGGGGIYMYKAANGSEISGNKISYNYSSCVSTDYGGGLGVSTCDGVSIMNNIISENSANEGGGIRVKNFDAEIINNTIVNNTASAQGGGLHAYNSNPIFINNILWDNQAANGAGIYPSSLTRVRYSNVQGGYTGNGNLNIDPLFVAGDSLYHVMCTTDTSQCLNRGIDSVLISGTWCLAPETDFAGDPRPQPIGTRPDIGAWEYDVVNGLEKIQDNKIPLVFALKQNYPNPFNPSTKIKYTLPKSDKVKMEIFNLLGQRIETLINKQMPAGSHEIEFIAKDLPSGVYLYRIESGNPSVGSGQRFQEVKKMVLLK